MKILRDELRQVNGGYEITIYLSEDRAEFAKELGSDPEKQNELKQDVSSYVKKKYPNLKVTTARILLGGFLISTIPLGGAAQAATPATGGPKDIDKSSAYAQTAIWNLVDKKIIEGDEQGNFNPQGTMNRDAFTAMLVRALVTNPADLVTPETPTFKDIPKDHWAYSYVETAVQKGLINGTSDDTFSPNDSITREQMATIFVRALGVPDAELKGMGDKLTFADKDKIPDYAKDAVGYAVAKGLMQGTSDTTFDGGNVATREQVAVVMDRYINGAGGGVVTPEKVSVAEAKATGVYSVTVTFDKEVDTEKAKLELKKGSTVQDATVKFADDKKSAVITTEAKISAGTYTVTLSGLDETTVAKTTAEFTAENEKLAKIEFLNADETIAMSEKAIIRIKASNQYGENSSLSSAAYKVFAGDNDSAKLTKTDSGELQLTINTVTYGNNKEYIAGQSVIPINIYNTDSAVSAAKTFKVGTKAFISKVELGTLKYSTGNDSLSGTGEYATIDVLQYDQYGNLISYTEPADAKDEKIKVTLNGYEPNLAEPEVGDSNDDDIADIKFSLLKNVDKTGDYTYNVYSEAGNATVTVKVASQKVANKVELGEFNGVMAAGDEDVYVPLIAYDAAGNKLSVDDLVSESNYKFTNGEIDKDSHIKLDVSGADSATLQTSGEHRGMIKLTNIDPNSSGVVSLTARIGTNNVNSVSTKTYTIQDARIPDRFKLVTDPAKKIASNGESEFKFLVYDQYGKELKKLQKVDDNGNVDADDGAAYTVEVTSSIGTKIQLYKSINDVDTLISGIPGATTDPDGKPLVVYDDVTNKIEDFNDEFKFKAGVLAAEDSAADKEATFTARILKGTDEIAKVTRTIKAASPGTELTYSVTPVTDLFNAIDSDMVSEDKYDTAATLTVADQENVTTSKFAKEIKLVAKDNAGDIVAIAKQATAAYTDNTGIAKAGVVDGKAYVIGNKKGTAKVTVSFLNNKGETVTQTLSVNVKDDAVTSAKLKAGNTAANVGDSTNAFTLMNLKVTDNYGVEYEDADAQKYNYLFGVTFGVTNVQGGTVSIDEYGNITNNGATSFDITATTAAGLSATTAVTTAP